MGVYGARDKCYFQCKIWLNTSFVFITIELKPNLLKSAIVKETYLSIWCCFILFIFNHGPPSNKFLMRVDWSFLEEKKK